MQKQIYLSASHVGKNSQVIHFVKLGENMPILLHSNSINVPTYMYFYRISYSIFDVQMIY